MDHVLGVIHLRDLLITLPQHPSVDLRSLTKPLLVVPENKSIRLLLRDLQRQRKVMALVINEYGGPEGLVTMEDILEELVGEIQDDSDEERPWWNRSIRPPIRCWLPSRSTISTPFYLTRCTDRAITNRWPGSCWVDLAGCLVKARKP
jgi:hypothetical protein